MQKQGLMMKNNKCDRIMLTDCKIGLDKMC
jgi:hypothetical protein